MNGAKRDLVYLFLIISVVVGLPFGLKFYDHRVWGTKIPKNARVFTLTGHAESGWIREDVHALDAIALWRKNGNARRPVVLEVSKGDEIVLKLKSSDVVHGFSLKDFGVFISDGIQPGKVKLVSFTADKAGTFTFSCNAICGDNHQNMQGTLVVRA
ncbi:MAG: cupredoxin domain-containing protein [Pseudomonadota bacterium]